MLKLVLIRHGESAWNKENLFTGWTDVGLSEKGLQEALQAAETLKKGGYSFDLAFTSVLKRAIKTLWIVLEEMDLMWIPVRKTWRLNERHYGALQGLNKKETVGKYGEAQVAIWRRSYDTPPPILTKDDTRWPGYDPRYADVAPRDIPFTESLKDTVARFFAVLGARDRPGVAERQKRDHCRPWQQPSRACQTFGWPRRRPHRFAQYSHGNPFSLRIGWKFKALAALLSRRPGGDQKRHRSGRFSNKKILRMPRSQIMAWLLHINRAI